MKFALSALKIDKMCFSYKPTRTYKFVRRYNPEHKIQEPWIKTRYSYLISEIRITIMLLLFMANSL
jgi:hypothetical protein